MCILSLFLCSCSSCLSQLAQNELTNYDPVAEAFKIYDPQETGYVDLAIFRDVLSNLGFEAVNDQDLQTLVDTADVDGDGRINLSDFRRMLAHQASQFDDGLGGGTL